MKETRSTETDDITPVGGSKSKTFFQKTTDTFRELAFIFILTITLGGVLYSLFEKINVLDGIWWAFVTAFTVGYGDVVPGTFAGRVVAALLMSVSVFVIVPLVTALMTKKMVVDDDAWTNEEQKYVLDTARRMNDYLDRYEKPAKATTPRAVRANVR